MSDVSSAAAVEVRGLTFSYAASEQPALRDVSLRVNEGEFVAVEGPTGAGKTTLCLALNGIIPHATPGRFRGDVLIHGVNTKGAKVAELARRVGIVYQDPESQLFGLTVEEDIAFGLENLGIERDEMHERVRWALHAVDLVGLESRAPSALSGGQKQRLAIASVLAMRPSVIVLDEPTAELDPMGKESILVVVRRLCEEFGLTVVLVEHESDFIAQYADRLMLLVDGAIVADESPRRTYTRVPWLRSLDVRLPQVALVTAELWENRHPDRPTQPNARDELPVPVLLHDAVQRSETALRRVVRPTQPPGGRRVGLHTVDATARSGEAAVLVEDLSFQYADGPLALRNVSLRFDRNEYVALIGQNGSGKSTLARLLNGLLRPTVGRVVTGGIDTTTASVAELSRHVGYVFQNPDHELFAESVEAELAFGPTHQGLGADECAARVESAMELCGIERLRHEHPLFTSRGERQLIAIASIIAMQPDVLIFDEPTTGLDERYHGLLLDLLDRLHGSGQTVIVITHDMRLVAERTKRTVVLLDGRVLVDAPTAHVFDMVDLLRETEIQPPQVTQLSHALAPFGIPTALRVDELAHALGSALGVDALALQPLFEPVVPVAIATG